jgi:magnesium transporter
LIVDCAVYQAGKRRPGELRLGEAFEACQQDGAFCWLGLYEPGPEEFEAMRREFDLHELAVEDAIKGHQRPKIELYDDTMLVVLKPVRYIDSEELIETGEIILFVNKTFVVSVRRREASALGEVRRKLDNRPDLLAHGPGAVLYAIMDKVVDDYAPVADGLERDIEEIEEQVFSTDRQRVNPAERIFSLEREVLEYHRALAPLAGPVGRLASGEFELARGELQSYFRDVHDHVLRDAEREVGFRALLSSILQANLTQVQVRQNEDMRRVTAWVAIIAVPTMIAGIYGMNFEHMPELKWKLGYPAVLALIVLICIVLYLRFRAAGWLGEPERDRRRALGRSIRARIDGRDPAPPHES